MRLNQRPRRWAVTATAFLFLGIFSPTDAAAAPKPSGPEVQPEVQTTAVGSGGPVTDGHPEPARRATSAPAKEDTQRTEALPRRQVVSYELTIGAHQVWYAQVFCPAGMKVSGGGSSNSSAGEVTLVDSYAIDGGNGWLVDVANYSGGTPTFKVYAVCWSDLDNYEIIDAKAEVLPGSSGGARAGLCTRGGVLGGGGWADTYFNTLIRYSRDSYLSWFFEIKNFDSVRHTVHAQVVCGRHYGTTQPTQYGQLRTLAPGEYNSAFVPCGASDPVLYGGGGYAGDATMTDIYPEANGWRMYARNPTSQPLDIYVVALCGD